MIEFCRCFARRVKPVEIPLAYPARQKYSAKPFYLLGRSTVHGVVFDIFSRNPVGWISPRLREAQSASVIHHLHCGSMVDYAALIHPEIHPNTYDAIATFATSSTKTRLPTSLPAAPAATINGNR